MKITIPKTIYCSVVFIALLIITSLITQLMLARSGQPVSRIAFVVWTVIYVASAYGLIAGRKVAWWGGVIISTMQMIIATIWTFVAAKVIFGHPLPTWYSISTYGSLLLSLGLLLCITNKSTRDYIAMKRSSTGVEDKPVDKPSEDA